MSGFPAKTTLQSSTNPLRRRTTKHKWQWHVRTHTQDGRHLAPVQQTSPHDDDLATTSATLNLWATTSNRPNLKYWLKGPGQVMPSSPQLPHCITPQTVTSSDRPNLKYWFKRQGQVMLNAPGFHLFLLYTVSKWGAQCHWLRTRPHNNGTNKSAKPGQSAERGNASHTRKHQGHTHWDHEVHARPPISANQTESGVGESLLQCHRKSPQPTPPSREGHKGMQDGTGQVLDGSILQVCQLTELKQTKEWEMYPNRFRRLNETLFLSKIRGKSLSRMASRQNRVRDQASHSKKNTANLKTS